MSHCGKRNCGGAAERGKVASVFINRLNKNMPLQTDPTIIYGMGEAYNGNTRRKDLETPWPYNTYLNLGLSQHRLPCLRKALCRRPQILKKPIISISVAICLGGHKRWTLTEHNRAVQEYLRWYRNRQKGK